MNLLKNKRALSTVVTTLIILVVSVLLATVVTFYAINVTTTRVQEESLFLTKQHVWYNTTGDWAQCAMVIVNTGGKDVVLDKLTARGQDSAWTDVFYWRTNTITISNDLEVTPNELPDITASNTTSITVQGTAQTFTRATDDLTLISGYTMVIYAANPDSIALNDVGITIGLTLFTSNAQYYKETNVEAAQ
ncbi:MAG: hypothetical protein PVF96_06230 [Candidatus Bathyarchaeota archaeon]|jgi:hypothetical protein